jgi:hypothetical protein
MEEICRKLVYDPSNPLGRRSSVILVKLRECIIIVLLEVSVHCLYDLQIRSEHEEVINVLGCPSPLESMISCEANSS